MFYWWRIIATACERFSEGYLVAVERVITFWAICNSKLVSPLSSLPKSIATVLSLSASAIIFGEAEIIDSLGHGTFLSRDDVPITKLHPTRASSRLLTTWTVSIRSLALAAKAVTSSDGNYFGFTKHKLPKPIVFMALNVDPILPELDVSIRIILTCLFKPIIYSLCRYHQYSTEH